MIRLCLGLFAATLLLKLVATFCLTRLDYSYTGDDYPQTWPVHRKPVLIAADNSIRYRLDTQDGANEWDALVPADGLLYLGNEHRPYTISLFHQLKCLDILRSHIIRNHTDAVLSRHCLNYVKQMVLCRGDLHLEPFQYASNEKPIDLTGLYQCNDWGAVYDETLRNQREHVMRSK